jgi:hypothetical protein
VSEVAVVLIGVVAFAGSILWKLRRGSQGGSSHAGTQPEQAQPPDSRPVRVPPADLCPPSGHLAVPVEPPDPLVVALCSALPVEVTSVRLRKASHTEILY